MRRRTMLAPILPSPTKPICIVMGLPVVFRRDRSAAGRAPPAEGGSAGAECLGQARFELTKAGVRVDEVDPDDREIMSIDRLEVALRLRVDQLAKGERPARDRAVDGVVGG